MGELHVDMKITLDGGIGEYEGVWRMAYLRGRKASSSPWHSASAEPATSAPASSPTREGQSWRTDVGQRAVDMS